MTKPLSKDFDKKLSEKILPKFAAAKGWGELINVVSNFKLNLKKYSEFNMYKLTEKALLARRLSYGLNPLLPGGLHEVSLEVYSDLFENIRRHNNNLLGDDLGLYSSGLLPFFNNASNINKSIFLSKIVNLHYLNLEQNELMYILPGLIASLLPGLAEQNDALLKELRDIFIILRKKVSDSKFFGTLWMIILRTPKLRLTAIRYINDCVANYDKLVDSDELKKAVATYFPNHECLIVNSLKASIEDTEVLVQRAVMDFVIAKLPINNKIFEENEKIAIIVSSLKLLIKNENSLARRLFAWLLSSTDDDAEMGDPKVQYMIELLIKSIKLIFQSNDYKFGMRVLDLLFKHQARFVDYVLPEVSWELLTSLYYNRKNPEVMEKALKFFEYDNYYLEVVWKALAKASNPINYFQKDLIDFHTKITEDLENQIQIIKTSFFKNKSENQEKKLITTNFKSKETNSKILEEEKSNDLKILPYIIQFCLDYFFIKNVDDKYHLYLPLISNMLFHIASEKIIRIEDIKNIKNNLTICLNLAIDMYVEEEKIAAEILLGKTVNKHENISHSIQKNLKINIKLYETFYIQIINYLIINSKIDDEKLRLFQHATDLVLKIQIYKDRELTPEWLVYLIKLIFTSKNLWLSLEALEFILDMLNMKIENDDIREIKLFLRQESLEYILNLSNKLFLKGVDSADFANKFNEENEKELIKILGTLNDFRTSNPLQKNRNSLEFAMAKLWRLIPDQSVQKKVTDLLVKFSISDPDLFSNAVSSTLNSTDLEEMVSGINTFAQFWKLSAEYYPEKRFFKTGECMFKILDYLDHPHPLIRHVSKSWLSQTTETFDKILDPLLLVLLDPETKYYSTPTKELVITDIYDSKRIVDAFRKLKNIIVNFSEYHRIIKFCSRTKPNKMILDLCEQTENTQHQGVLEYMLETYLDVLVHVAMRFIRAVFVESVSSEFYKEHFSVKAASCEFLEYLLISVEDKSKVIKIANKIIDVVLYGLLEKIVNQEVVLQVQLLNLLKALILSTESAHLENSDIMVRILSSKLLHNCLNLGITIDYIFVRTHFMVFLESCFPLFKKLLPIEENLRIGNKLLITCSAFLVKRVDYFNSLNKKKIIKTDKLSNFSAIEKQKTWEDKEEKEKNMSEINVNNACNENNPESNTNQNDNEEDKYNFFLIKNYLPEYSETRSYDENDIATILKSILKILINFLHIKSPITTFNDIKWAEIDSKIDLTPSSGYTSYFLSIFVKKTKEISSNLKSGNTDNNIQKDIIVEVYTIYEEVFKSFLNSWISNSNSYMTKDLCLSSNGMVTLDENSSLNFSDQNLIGERLSSKQSYLSVRDIITNINHNMLAVSPMDYFIIIFKIWLDEEFNRQNKQNKLLLIEIIVSMNIPMSIILKTLISTIDIEKIGSFTKSKIKFKGIYPNIISYNNTVYENRICHFLYSILCFTKYFETCWPEFIEFFEVFTKSKSPSTWIWLFEIMTNLLIKHPVNKLFKTKLKEIFEGIATKLTEFALLDVTDFSFDLPGKVIRPVPPTLYENVTKEVFGDEVFTVPKKKITQKADNLPVFLNEKEEIEIEREIINQMRVSLEKRSSSIKFEREKINLANQEKAVEPTPISKFYRDVYEKISNGVDLKHEELTKLYRITAFINLKEQYYDIIRQINPPEKVDKATLHMQWIIKHLLTVLNKKVAVEKIYTDTATVFLQQLVNKANTQLITAIKPGLLDFFYDQDFFKMSRNSFGNWMCIIRDFVQFNNKILEEMFSEFTNGYGEHLNKKLEIDKIRILVLRRISFVIYSCDKDNFKIVSILENVKDILIQHSDNLHLEAEVFLLLRIMFLKFSKEQLVELLRNLWPIIFAEMTTILFNKKKEFSLDLILSCLKFIECISLANMEEFCLYQWSFILDGR